MKNKKFYLWLIVSAFVFAVFSLGGCGGGHGNLSTGNGSGNGNGGNEEASKDVLSVIREAVPNSDMAAVMGNSKFNALITDVSLKQGNYKNMPDTHFFFKFDDKTKARILSELSDDEKEIAEGFFFNAKTAKERYDNGEALILVAPDKDFVNEALEAVGLNPAYENDENLEALTLSKREKIKTVESGDMQLSKLRTLHFLYTVPHVDNFELSDDISAVTASGDKITFEENPTTDPELEEEFEQTEEVRTIEEFNVARWENMFKWCASIDKEAEIADAEASSIEFNAAAVNDITKVSSVQLKTIDFSYRRNNYNIFGHSFNIDRETSVTLKIYNCHSFNERSDYYFVSSNLKTIPKGFSNKLLDLKSKVQRSIREAVNFVCGYTEAFNLSFNDKTDGAVIDNDNSYPKTTAPNESRTASITWYRDDGDLIAGTSHFGNLSYISENTIKTTENWRLDNIGTSWDVFIKEPTQGVARKFGNYVNVNDKSKREFSLDSQFILKVEKSSWEKNTTLPLNVAFNWVDGCCSGRYFRYDSSLKKIEHPMQFYALNMKKSNVVTVDMPQHSWTHMDIYTFNKYGDRAGVMYMTEGDTWEVSVKDLEGNDVDWVEFEGIKAGEKQPGPVPKMDIWLYFRPLENTTGQTRQARIHFTSNFSGGTSETLYIDLIQTSREKIDPFAN